MTSQHSLGATGLTDRCQVGHRLGIDASNIRGGGGLVHLVEVLRSAQPSEHGFGTVIVWGGSKTLSQIEDRPWLQKVHEPMLDRGLAFRSLWQTLLLDKRATESKCTLLFVPGGSYAGSFKPLVTMNQNLLPYELSELSRFGVSMMTLKLLALRVSQTRTIRNASGVIYLTRYACEVVARAVGASGGAHTVVAHGTDPRFRMAPRSQRAIAEYSMERPFKIVYVSIVDMYKHQWNVAAAVAHLRASGFPVSLDMIGPGYRPAVKRLADTLNALDPEGKFLHYRGPVPHDAIHHSYHEADLAVFASSCESFGQILTEKMNAGLPIACSKRSAMPEILGSNGVYFDPENHLDIATALESLLINHDRRQACAFAAYEAAGRFSWQRCATETFSFLSEIAMAHQA